MLILVFISKSAITQARLTWRNLTCHATILVMFRSRKAILKRRKSWFAKSAQNWFPTVKSAHHLKSVTCVSLGTLRRQSLMIRGTARAKSAYPSSVALTAMERPARTSQQILLWRTVGGQREFNSARNFLLTAALNASLVTTHIHTVWKTSKRVVSPGSRTVRYRRAALVRISLCALKMRSFSLSKTIASITLMTKRQPAMVARPICIVNWWSKGVANVLTTHFSSYNRHLHYLVTFRK